MSHLTGISRLLLLRGRKPDRWEWAAERRRFRDVAAFDLADRHAVVKSILH